MRSKNVLKEKSFDFAVRIVNLYKYLIDDKKEYVLSKQLLRSGTAIGALHREAERKKDFVHKLAIAQKECNESIYWLELLQKTDYLSESQFESINSDAVELIKLITSIIKSAKKSLTTNN
jgi:four helix bundle protein